MDCRRILFAAFVALIAAPGVSGAQGRALPSVGYLGADSPKSRPHLVDAFRAGLKEGGYTDGKDVVIEQAWAEGNHERLRPLADHLLKQKVAVLVSIGGTLGALAAKAATSTVPIVFVIGGDPVTLGLAKSLSRPGMNATGITNTGVALEPKRFELLNELVPAAGTIAYLVNPENALTKPFVAQAHSTAQSLSKRLNVIEARSDGDLETAFEAMQRGGVRALVVAPDVLFVNRRTKLAALAARYRVAAVYPLPEFALAGGLMSYGADSRDMYRQAGIYTARILKGAKPAELPIMQASKLELVFNVGVAKKIGLTVSRDFLARVDRVID